LNIFSEKSFLKIWSNLAFLVPFFVAVINGLLVYSFVVLVCAVVSTIYHYYDEKRFAILDMITANSLIFSNLVLSYLFNFSFPFFYVAMVFVVIAFYYFFKQHKSNKIYNHAMWHMSSVIITMMCIFGYLGR